jgi:hypothetical protein
MHAEATILRLMYAAMKKDNFSQFDDLLRKYDSKLSFEQRIAVLCDALVAAVAQKGYWFFADFWKSHGSKLPAKQRRKVVYLAAHALIEKGDFRYIGSLMKECGSKLLAEQRREVVYLAIHAAIKQSKFYEIVFLMEECGYTLSAEQRGEVVYLAIRPVHLANKHWDLGKIRYLLKECGSKLPAEQYRKVIRIALDAVVDHVIRTIEVYNPSPYIKCYENWLKEFGSQLSDKELIAVIRHALDAAIEQNCFSLIIFLKHRYSSKLSADEKLIKKIHDIIYAAIEKGKFSDSQTLLEIYGSELISREMVNVLKEMMSKIDKSLTTNLATCPQYVVETKSALLSWANDQCQKIARAYAIKTTGQTQAQGEALIAAESITAAMNQVILVYQDVPPTGQNIVQEVQPKKRVQKALADLYCTVAHAYRIFLSKHTALHQ